MNFHDLFLKPYESYSVYQIFLEFIGASFGILSVYFSVKKNIWVYPTGIISTGIYIFIMFNAGYLGDMMINFYYTVMSIYGWVLWSENSKDHIHIEVEKADRETWQYSIILFAVSMVLVIFIYYFKPYIDNHFSMNGVKLNLNHMDKGNWMDVFTTSIFLVGMWLMAKRKIENWLFWIVGDLICIPMLVYRGLGITSLQYLIFTIMAVIGYFEWKKSIQPKKVNS
ncbi:nicotinamide riboside transporter PnuC [Halpernia sp. GG3]